MHTTAQASPAAADPAGVASEHASSAASEAPPTFSFPPSKILSLRETFQAGAALPDEELQVFLEGFKEHLLQENLPWMGEVIGGQIREVGHAKYRVGLRHGLVWGTSIGSLVALLSVAACMYWAGA